MSEPEIDVNSTHEILKELRTFTKEIRDLLRQKAVQENGITQQTNGASHQGEDSPEVPDATAHQPLNTETANIEIDNSDNWPNDETIARYRNRCAKHKSECEKMQVELDCFIAHLCIVGGDKDTIERAESLRKGLLDPVQCLEKAYDATADGRLDAIVEVRNSFDSLDGFFYYFARSPHQKDALYPDKVEQWRSLTANGWRKIRDFVEDGKFVECLKFIHDVFFSELETAMSEVVEALTTFEEKFASEWLATQKTGDFDKHIRSIFPTTDSDGSTSAWASPVDIAQFKERSMNHKLSCNEMREELGHLIAHYGVVGGDKEVVKEAMVLQGSILAPLDYLERALIVSPNKRREAMVNAVVSFKDVYIYVNNFQKSMYHQKHAFYFRKVKKWVSCLWNGMVKITSLLRESNVAECQRYIYNNLLSDLEEAMIGASKASKKVLLPGEKADTGSVVEELKTFRKESLPKFLVDQMERDTTRYVNLTTIATFFSSVTATTLQFTYAATDSVPSNSLRGVVNLFWFLSLVFSVSSGVNSLLGLTWRKSSIYNSRVPPKLIRMWLGKAPMLFLIIAAVTFVIGLNLFAYLSLQPRYVSYATNILTGLHGMCLLAVTAWFIYQLKHESIWAGWVRTVMKLITKIAEWVGTGVKWIGKSMKWLWKLVKRPYEKYKQNKLHLQRNIYWAFGIDNRVARLNCDMIALVEWPEPYLLSKLIRCIAYPIKRCWLVTKKAISDLSRSVRAHICVPSPTGCTGDDIEMGETVRRKEGEAAEESSSDSPSERRKNDYRRSLRKMFGEAELVQEIMKDIGRWEIGREKSAERYIKIELWGYPALQKQFFDDVRPALVEAREKRRRERVIEEQKDMTAEHADDDSHHRGPEVVGQDKDAASVSTQLSQPASLDKEPGPSGETHRDVQQGNTGALEPTSGDPIQQVRGREDEATAPNEMEEVSFMSETTIERLHIGQSEKDEGE